MCNTLNVKVDNLVRRTTQLEYAQRALQSDLAHQHDQIRSLEVAIKGLKRKHSDAFGLDCVDELVIQSTDTNTDNGDQALTEEHQTTEFADGISGDTDKVEIGHDQLSQGINSRFYDLGSYLSRPVLIATYDIPQGEAYNQRYLRPWDAWIRNNSIAEKVSTFKYIRGDLKIKVLINSSPFIYGCYGLSYQPLYQFNAGCDPEANPNAFNQTMMTSRQYISLESHKNKGGEMTLPFLYPADWLTIVSPNLTTSTNAKVREMGKLTLFPFASFRSANGTATGNVNIRVYAWSDNMQLAGPTVAVQSKDEYGQGPVSKVASSVAGAARALSDIPVIGIFAKATEIGASAVSGIASLFGWTNVPVIADAIPYKSQPFHQFASSGIGTVTEKLTLDPKNELSVDPQIWGTSNEDELAIQYIAGREAWFGDRSWAQTAASGDVLVSISVSPQLLAWENFRIFRTPMCHVSNLFKYWRGSIVYRLKVVASPYHQGRIRISYDPNGNSTIDGTTQITKILDLSVTDEVEITVPFMAATSWLNMSTDSVNPGYSLTGFSPYSESTDNGRLFLSVETALTAPDTTADVEMLLFARAGDDFELANPVGDTENYSTTVYLDEVQSRDEIFVQSADEIVSADGLTKYYMGKPGIRAKNMMHAYMGEDIRSVRQLMRRTNFYQREYRLINPSLSGVDKVTRYYNIYPSETGPSVLGGTNTATITRFSPSTTTAYTNMVKCFVGQRGSMDYTINHLSDETITSKFAARRQGLITNSRVRTVENGSGLFNAYSDYTNGTQGLSLQNDKSQTSLQFVVPLYNKYKFVPAGAEWLGGDSAEWDTDQSNFEITTSKIVTNPSQDYEINYDMYYRIGTDFQVVHFIGVPPMSTTYDGNVTGSNSSAGARPPLIS